MQDFPLDRKRLAQVFSRDVTRMDQGLRSYMLGVYGYMCAGLGLTALISFLCIFLGTTYDPDLSALRSDGSLLLLPSGLYVTELGMKWLFSAPVLFGSFGVTLLLVFLLNYAMHRMSTRVIQGCFFLYAGLVGVAVSASLVMFTPVSVVQIFLCTATGFGALSIYGYTTERDLSPFGNFLFLSLVGLLSLMFLNLFMQSALFDFALSVFSVLLFSGLTVYDTQQIKEMYYKGDCESTVLRKSVRGALRLYLDFLNMFLSLLSLFGKQK